LCKSKPRLSDFRQHIQDGGGIRAVVRHLTKRARIYRKALYLGAESFRYELGHSLVGELAFCRHPSLDSALAQASQFACLFRTALEFLRMRGPTYFAVLCHGYSGD
jgi:hypothetical protein